MHKMLDMTYRVAHGTNNSTTRSLSSAKNSIRNALMSLPKTIKEKKFLWTEI